MYIVPVITIVFFYLEGFRSGSTSKPLELCGAILDLLMINIVGVLMVFILVTCLFHSCFLLLIKSFIFCTLHSSRMVSLLPPSNVVFPAFFFIWLSRRFPPSASVLLYPLCHEILYMPYGSLICYPLSTYLFLYNNSLNAANIFECPLPFRMCYLNVFGCFINMNFIIAYDIKSFFLSFIFYPQCP